MQNTLSNMMPEMDFSTCNTVETEMDFSVRLVVKPVDSIWFFETRGNPDGSTHHQASLCFNR